MDGLCSSCLLEARLVGCYTINSSIGDFTEIHVFELWCCRYVFDWWEVIPTVPLAMGYKLASHCNSLIYHRRFRLIYQYVFCVNKGISMFSLSVWCSVSIAYAYVTCCRHISRWLRLDAPLFVQKFDADIMFS